MNERMKEYLCHMTDAEKKAYNAEYYRNHKNYWQDYYAKGQTVGRPMARQKNVTGNGTGLYRRGSGLNSGPVGSSGRPNWQRGVPGGYWVIEGEMGGQEQTQSQHSKPAVESLKNAVKQAVSKIAKDSVNAGKQFAKDWANGVKQIFKKKPVTVTNTWSGTAGGQHISGSNSFTLRGKKRK